MSHHKSKLAPHETDTDFTAWLEERVLEIRIENMLALKSKEHDLEQAGWIRVTHFEKHGHEISVQGCYWRRPGPRGGTLFRSTERAHRYLTEVCR